MSAPGKIVVYTAIVGNYNPLRNPAHIDPSIDYVCFTDEPRWFRLANQTVWQGRPFPPGELDSTRTNRQVKLLPHRYFPEYEYSVYVDGSIRITGDIRTLLEEYKYPKMLCHKHPKRDCIYQEGLACIDLKKETPEAINHQLATYRAEGLPEHHGMIEANVLIRRHNDPEIVALMQAWWHELQSKSRRDQISFPYVAWRQSFWPTLMGEKNVWGSSEVFRLETTHHGDRKLTLADRLRILADIHLFWRFKK
jgi:hypothetical protein